MHLLRLMLIFATCLVAGCATSYIEPNGADIATISFRNASGKPDVLIQSFKVAEDCSGGRPNFKGKPRLKPNEEINVKIQADKDFTFIFGYGALTGGAGFEIEYCQVIATITPEKNWNYFARFLIADKKCYLRFEGESPNGDNKEVRVRYRKFKPPFLNSSPSCE
jgi:hypothetical protein